jgi:hypothetical protein
MLKGEADKLYRQWQTEIEGGAIKAPPPSGPHLTRLRISMFPSTCSILIAGHLYGPR